MIDLTETVKPKSDQLNADDLLSGPITVTVTKVSKQSTEQPIAINYDGDGGRPYYPCKSMRRVLIELWGKDGSQYIGRSMTLFRDTKVTWAGAEVGGIRISHMSNIDSKRTLSLTASKQSRKPYIVLPLGDIAPPKKAIDVEPLKLGADAASLRGSEALKAWFQSLNNEERIAIKPLMDGYKATAATHDTVQDDGVLDD